MQSGAIYPFGLYIRMYMSSNMEGSSRWHLQMIIGTAKVLVLLLPMVWRIKS